jgi:hypothetical protein
MKVVTLCLSMHLRLRHAGQGGADEPAAGRTGATNQAADRAADGAKGLLDHAGHPFGAALGVGKPCGQRWAAARDYPSDRGVVAGRGRRRIRR